MASNYLCFLDVAKSSMEKTGEDWTRNAVSRSYYSMYHSALRLLAGNRLPSTDENGRKITTGTHKRLSDYLCSGDAAKAMESDEKTLEKIGMKLRASHITRCEADYDLKAKVNRITAMKMITDTELMDEQITKLLS